MFYHNLPKTYGDRSHFPLNPAEWRVAAGRRLPGVRKRDDARPFLKWPGGKQRVAADIKAWLPQSYGTYFEPFIGGGALFFSLLPQGAFISDLNPELINAYRIVKHQAPALMRCLDDFTLDRESFYFWRNLDRQPTKLAALDDVERAARFIFLNKCCFGGNLRYNQQGQIASGFGNPGGNRRLYDKRALAACQEALRTTRIWQGTFLDIDQLVQAGDFVYFDPPYALDGRRQSTSVIEYTATKFDGLMQQSLAGLCRKLDALGVKFMVSNTDTEFVRDIFAGFRLIALAVPYSISARAEMRGQKQELLVTNYDDL